MRNRKRSSASSGCSRSDFTPTTRTPADERRFREIQEAYSNPDRSGEAGALRHRLQQRRNDRWRLVTTGTHAENDFEIEQMVRLTLLEALYTKRRVDPGSPAIYSTELESLLGRPREHLEFTIWYLVQRKFVTRDDQSRCMITADGVDYLEQNYKGTLQRKRLQGKREEQG